MMNTKIFSAFPGTGKSYLASKANQKMKIIDLDSGDYTLGYTDDGRVHNPNFPDNYISAIKEHIGKSDVLFIGCQPEVLTELRKEKIPFTLVYPERSLKDEYMNRFRKRQNSQSFIDLISNNWDRFLDFLENQKDCECIVLESEQYISHLANLS